MTSGCGPVAVWAVALVGIGGCFPPPHLKDAAIAETDVGTAPEVESEVEPEVESEVEPEVESEVEPEVESEVASEVEVEVEVEVDAFVPECDRDEDCTAFAAPPCRLARCETHACRTVDMAGTCDDGDPCTTVDACAGGVCLGRLYTAAEAKNWALAFGGDGADAALAATLHGDGSVDVVGGFQGTADLPGGFSIEAPDGNPHPFWVRVTPRGQVLRAVLIPPADTVFDEPPTSEVAMGVAVSDGVDARTIIGLRRHGGTAPPSRLVWVFDNGNIDGSVEIPGVVEALDSHPDGSALVAFRISGQITIPMADGATVAINPETSRAVVVARVRANGFVWAKFIQGPGTSEPVSLVDLSGDVAFSAVLSGDVSFAGAAMPGVGGTQRGVRFVLSENGGTIDVEEAAQLSWLRRWRRSQFSVTTFDFGAEGLGGPTTLAATDATLATSCEVALTLDRFKPDGTASTFAFVVPLAGGGLLLHGQLQGAATFPPGLGLDGGAGAGFFVVFDSGCQARAGWLSGLKQIQSEPNDFHYSAGVEAGFTRPVGLPDGGLVVATYARLPVDLGPAFDGVILNPIGGADAVIAGYTVPWIRGCATAP